MSGLCCAICVHYKFIVGRNFLRQNLQYIIKSNLTNRYAYIWHVLSNKFKFIFACFVTAGKLKFILKWSIIIGRYSFVLEYIKNKQKNELKHVWTMDPNWVHSSVTILMNSIQSVINFVYPDIRHGSKTVGLMDWLDLDRNTDESFKIQKFIYIFLFVYNNTNIGSTICLVYQTDRFLTGINGIIL